MYIGIIEGKHDHTVIVTLPKHYEIELKHHNLNTFTSLLQRDGEIELNHRQHADTFSYFFKRAPKIYSVHLSLLKGKSFLNHQEEQLLCTFALQGDQNETLLVEPDILRYKQLKGDSQHTHLSVDIRNVNGNHPSLYTGALSLQLRLKAFEEDWYN